MGESKAGKGLGTNHEERPLQPGSWSNISTRVLSAMEMHSRRPPTSEQLLCHTCLCLYCFTVATAGESVQLKARRGAATQQRGQSCSPCSSSTSQADVLEHEIKPHLTRSLKFFKKLNHLGWSLVPSCQPRTSIDSQTRTCQGWAGVISKIRVLAEQRDAGLDDLICVPSSSKKSVMYF